MDVERLMRDLKVDQLQEIQRNLQTEVEGKKEELREMVGRRYRDVLEASSEVFCSSSRIRKNQCRPLSREQQASVQRFIALHRLLAIIGGPDGDALSDAFAFTLAELLHKQLATEPLPPSIHSVVSGLTGRLIRTRRKLLYDLEEEIGHLSEPNWVANQLTALALLQGADYEKLLDAYLKSRENYMANLTNESSSLLNVVTELKMTLVIVEQLFAQGELVRIVHAAAVSTYRPGKKTNVPLFLMQCWEQLMIFVGTRLSNLRLVDEVEKSGSELSRARLCLALLQCNSVTFCLAMNKDGKRIASASRLLSAAAEESLTWRHVCLQEWERLELNEVGVVEVPIVLSPPLQSALFALSSRFGDDSVAHLLTRSVRKQLAAQVCFRLILQADSVQRTWIQLLFDCLVLNTMFTDEKYASVFFFIHCFKMHVEKDKTTRNW
uniref:Conserved oligomeric Golgi complex subunit 1 n=1 Tax=Angiostrongylus cantonensis TaxID=6313 RepID=A0A158PA46_ANGCA